MRSKYIFPVFFLFLLTASLIPFLPRNVAADVFSQRVMFGTGAPSGTAPTGKLYLRTSNGHIYGASGGSWIDNFPTVSSSRTINTTSPITGGGDLSADRTIACATCEVTTNKDATGGYAGLTLFKINFKNAANTFTSFFTNSNTAARTYTFQDRNGTIADDTDLALKAPLASPTFTGTVTTASGSAGSPGLLVGSDAGLYNLGTRLGVSTGATLRGFFDGNTGGRLVVYGIAFDPASTDVQINRSAAGMAEVNSGTVGTYRDLRLRGLQYSTGTRPTCDSTTRGLTWYVAGGAGVLDTYELCRKAADDSYAWVSLF